MGTPIGRPALVRLFSTILKREDGKHFLVYPVEKVGIRVDDAPFLAVEMLKEADDRGRLLRFPHQRRRLGAMRFRAPAAIRGRGRRRPHALSSRPRRPVGQGHTGRFIMIWLTWARRRVVDGRPMFGIASAGEFFAMADAEQVRGAL